MPIGPKRLPLLVHVDELRKRLIIIVAVLGTASTVAYAFAKRGFDFIMAPITPLLGGKEFIVLGPFDKFTLQFKVGLYMAFVVTSPIVIYQVLAFLLPALKPKERRFFYPTFAAIIVLFLAGNWFAYSEILNPGFKWMLSQGDFVAIEPRADMWLNAVLLFLLGFGIAFQLPVVVFMLMIFRIVPYASLRKQWRIVYVVLMIVASVATPDWNPINMLILFAVLAALYEGSMALARVVLRRRIAAEKAAGLA